MLRSMTGHYCTFIVNLLSTIFIPRLRRLDVAVCLELIFQNVSIRD